MAGEQISDALAQQEWLDPISDVVQKSIEDAYRASGRTGQQIKNLLSGTWLGHPVHPAITDVPVGAFTASLVFDLLDASTGSATWAAAADATLGIGLIGATGAALSGLNDWHFTTDRPRRIGMAHALLNVGATSLYLTSWLLRRAGARRTGRMLSYAAYGTIAFSAWIGGDIVYDQRVGINHAPEEAPTEFVPVLDESTLQEGKPRRVDANGVPVMVVRSQGHVYALGETCSHLGGPLAEGEVSDGVVTCPWHGSQFELATGHIVNGPATFPQPCFQTRIRNGKVEVGPRCLALPAHATSVPSTATTTTTTTASGQAIATPS
jgi:nitrite reductase/ring-hydroxylating ferredoxin subunit